MSFWDDTFSSATGFVTDPIGSTSDMLSDGWGMVSSAGHWVGDVWEGIFNPSTPTISAQMTDASGMQSQIMKETGLQQQQQLSAYNAQAQNGDGAYALPSLGGGLSSASDSGAQLYYKTGLDNYMNNQKMKNAASNANKGAESATNMLTQQFFGGAMGGLASLAGSMIGGEETGGDFLADSPSSNLSMSGSGNSMPSRYSLF